jgi:repressor LexA
MDRDTPSVRQFALLSFLADYQERYGVSATMHQISEYLGMRSPDRVRHHLRWLSAHGYLIQDLAVTLRLTLKALKLLGKNTKPMIPLLGSIAAGLPLMVGEMDDVLEGVDPSRYPPETYALRVVGDSMIEDQIADGDFVIIAPKRIPRQGDTIVATHWTEGNQVGVTLKHFYRDPRQVRLIPANKKYPHQIIPADVWDREWIIQGVFIEVRRRFG